MVDTRRVCSRHNHIEGEEYSFGKATFELGYKSCDHCIKRSRRDLNKESRKRAESFKMKVRYDKAVYAIMKGSEITYIGSSDSAGWRLYEHFNKGVGHSVLAKNGINRLSRELDYSWSILWHGDSIDDARHQEKMLIQIHQPKFNKIKYKNYEG